MSEWLNNLKVGDKVVIGGGLDGDIISRVERLTNTLIITAAGSRFRKDGHAPGQSRCILQEPTPEILNRIRRVNLARHFRRYDWQELPLETLVAVFKLLPKS